MTETTKACPNCQRLLAENEQLDQRRRHAVTKASELQQDKSTLEDRVWVLQEQLKNERAT